MGLLGKDMRDYKEKTQSICPVPVSVQDLIPIVQVSESGIFQLEKKAEDTDVLFDRAYIFQDANYETGSEIEKVSFVKKWCKILEGLNVSYKICILNYNRDMSSVRRNVFLKGNNEIEHLLADSINSQIEHALVSELSGLERIRVLVISCKRKNFQRAEDFYKSVGESLESNFTSIGSSIRPLNGIERLKLLHDYYRLGREAEFDYTWEDLFTRKLDWRDIFPPHSIRHWQNEYGTYDGSCLIMDGRYVQTLYIPTLPHLINPDSMQKVINQKCNMIFTIDVASVPRDVAEKRLDYLQMQTGHAIEKQQEIRNKQRAYSSRISFGKRRERDELEDYQDIMRAQNENFSYLGVYVTISASSKQNLDNAVTAFKKIADDEKFYFEPLFFRQVEGINTAMPTGMRYITEMTPVLTQPISGFVPFVVQELYQEGGIYYGANQVSKNVILGDRKTLKNGNGFVLGVTGSGKSVTMKMEMLQILLKTDDVIYYIDPQNEMEGIASIMDQAFIRIGSATGHHINPLGMETLKYMDTSQTFRRDKAELMQTFFAMLTDGNLTSQDKSIIVRCTNLLYRNLDPGSKKEPVVPTLVDFAKILKEQPEAQARELLLALEQYTTEPMDIFAKQTNVDLNGKRLTVFGLSDLGEEQKGIGILFLLELLRNKMAENTAKGICTWLYVDEFHFLISNEYSAYYMQKIFKEGRKNGHNCTGATQQISDITRSRKVETMLCNSDFLTMLSMGDAELEEIQRIFKISDNLLEYLRNAPSGMGLLKFGNKYIPRDGTLDKDSAIYQMVNTNFHEIQRDKQRGIQELIQKWKGRAADKKEVRQVRKEVQNLTATT